MSSAILYLSIIAIWLCVLIPRWLKRDSARGAVVASDAAAPGDSPVAPAGGDGEAALADDGSAEADDHDGAPRPSDPLAPKAPSAAPLSAEEARRRIVAG